jgi:hypothetical protein
VVVVIMKQPNQLYGAVGTAARLGITRERAEKIQISSESNASITDAGSLLDSDEIKEA